MTVRNEPQYILRHNLCFAKEKIIQIFGRSDIPAIKLSASLLVPKVWALIHLTIYHIFQSFATDRNVCAEGFRNDIKRSAIDDQATKSDNNRCQKGVESDTARGARAFY